MFYLITKIYLIALKYNNIQDTLIKHIKIKYSRDIYSDNYDGDCRNNVATLVLLQL